MEPGRPLFGRLFGPFGYLVQIDLERPKWNPSYAYLVTQNPSFIDISEESCSDIPHSGTFPRPELMNDTKV